MKYLHLLLLSEKWLWTTISHLLKIHLINEAQVLNQNDQRVLLDKKHQKRHWCLFPQKLGTNLQTIPEVVLQLGYQF